MAAIKAGRLDRRIVIQRPGPPTDDGYTTLPGVLGTYFTCFAAWTPARGREIFEAMGREAYSGGVFRVRRNPTTAAIRTTDKVSYGGLIWDIVAIQELDRDAIELIVAASEVDDLPEAET